MLRKKQASELGVVSQSLLSIGDIYKIKVNQKKQIDKTNSFKNTLLQSDDIVLKFSVTS